MGLLAQLFRHKSATASEAASLFDSGMTAAAGEVRGVGAIAAAVGVATAHGMPAEFAIPVGEIIARLPEHCLWPGRHDPGGTLRIPAAEIAPSLERGRPELSLARLAALAPGIFRWERSAAEAPQIRLPIQKLLQQIRGDEASAAFMPGPAHPPPAPVALEPASPAHAPAPRIPVPPVRLLRPEMMPSVSVTARDHSQQPHELRASNDVAISTTLRAMVLGGVAAGGAANAPGPAGLVLAPRNVPAAPAPQDSTAPGPSVIHSPNEAAVPNALRARPDFAGLQNLFMTEAALDLTAVAALAAKLPGVQACVISGACGTAEAGDFSRGVSTGEMRAASDGLARIGGAAMEMQPRGESDIAIFLYDEACVAVSVKAGGFVPGVRDRLTRLAELLAGTADAR